MKKSELRELIKEELLKEKIKSKVIPVGSTVKIINGLIKNPYGNVDITGLKGTILRTPTVADGLYWIEVVRAPKVIIRNYFRKKDFKVLKRGK